MRFRKGHQSYWKGKKLSLEHRQKLSEAHKKLYREGKEIPPSRKGMSPPQKGEKLSNETKEKISLAKRGKSIKSKGVPRPQTRGANHPRWNGGRNRRYIHTMSRIEYKQWREAVFERDNYKCVLCGKAGYIEADHIKSWSLFPQLRFEISNGRTLCKDCHYFITYGKEQIYASV